MPAVQADNPLVNTPLKASLPLRNVRQGFGVLVFSTTFRVRDCIKGDTR